MVGVGRWVYMVLHGRGENVGEHCTMEGVRRWEYMDLHGKGEKVGVHCTAW